MSKKVKAKISSGFTLIELMIVMSIVALLMGMVGPLAINSLEKAQAKQEMLTVKNWLRKVSYRAFTTGTEHIVKLSGKNIILQIKGDAELPIENKTFESLFFQPQELRYSQKGFVSPKQLIGTFRGKPMVVDLNQWVNNEKDILIAE
jgi:prepilin-type N-terminal cleavage/methylation domain-containing protein